MIKGHLALRRGPGVFRKEFALEVLVEEVRKILIDPFGPKTSKGRSLLKSSKCIVNSCLNRAGCNQRRKLWHRLLISKGSTNDSADIGVLRRHLQCQLQRISHLLNAIRPFLQYLHKLPHGQPRCRCIQRGTGPRPNIPHRHGPIPGRSTPLPVFNQHLCIHNSHIPHHSPTELDGRPVVDLLTLRLHFANSNIRRFTHCFGCFLKFVFPVTRLGAPQRASHLLCPR